MKLRVMSDLHLEFNPFEPVELDEDVVILAGDISPMRYMNVPAWARRNWPTKDIVWVLGNHEHYATGWTIAEGVEQARAQAAEQEVVLREPLGEHSPSGAARRVHVLEENVVYSPWGVRFLGCTLWTDFKFRGDERDGMAWARHIMADFRGQVRCSSGKPFNNALERTRIHRGA